MAAPLPIFVDDSGRRRRVVRRLAMAATTAALGYLVVLVATLVGLPGLGRVPLPGVEELRTPAPAERTVVGDRTFDEPLPELAPAAPTTPLDPLIGVSSTTTTTTTVATTATTAPTTAPTTATTVVTATTASTTTVPPGRGSTTTTAVPPGRGSTTTAPSDTTTSRPGQGGGPPSTGGRP